MRKYIFPLTLIVSLALVACAGSPLNPGDGNSAPADNQPVATPAPSVVDNGAPSAPETTYGGTTAGCLSVADFSAMWKATKTNDGPGPLIQLLNNAFDMSGGSIGTQWPVGPQSVQPMSLVWTDLLSNQAPAGQGKWVPLRAQGRWGVFAVYEALTVPTPGRSARLCQSLDPAKDLAGWAN